MQQVPVCVDGRLAASRATGVASYGLAMRAALAATGAPPLLLDDARGGRFGGAAPWHERWPRYARARLPLSLHLTHDGDRLWARDIFRLSQTRFAATGRMLELRADGPAGIMHWTYPIPAWIAGWANIYTVHDVIPIVSPGLSPVDPHAMRRRIAAVAEQADRIITVSQAARRSIIDALSLPEEQVVDCGIAVTMADHAAGVPAGTLPANLAPGEYFLFCGLNEPRKNVPRLVAAWAASGTRRPLVLVGPDAQSIPPRPGLVLLPFQPRERLLALIRDARALLFPSLAEGFGLPVAEAMTLGTPVLTSDSEVLSETAGGAALLVDPHDQASIAAGIARLDQDATLCADLAVRGAARARAFTPSLFGARLQALHDEFAGDSRFAV